MVHVHYSYGDTFSKKSMDEITEIMMEDVNPVILEVLQNNFYKDVIFLGKSIGTIPIANVLMKRAEFLNSTMILLTPLLNFEDIFNSITVSPHHGLLVIGDQDTHFNPSFLPKLNSTNLNIEIIPNANHSLDMEATNTLDSVFALSKVMQRIQEIVT
ncbi:alpha/beta hydrolase [Psychrobacillus sp. FSL W7-1457]|uniref:alpha/beta hydrolase n=1 Tax=Psychrobacillus sp. FSL W7-1457 TaxID=2954547 RepID=UPI003159DDB0